MRLILYCSMAVTIILWAAQVGLAQTPPPDDPLVLLGYFNLHHAIDEAATNNSSLRHDAAVMMGISDADFALAARVASSVLAQCRTISRNASADRIDLSTVRQIETRRKAALLSGLKALRDQLPPRSWEALHRYINVTYRAGLRSETIPAR